MGRPKINEAWWASDTLSLCAFSPVLPPLSWSSKQCDLKQRWVFFFFPAFILGGVERRKFQAGEMAQWLRALTAGLERWLSG